MQPRATPPPSVSPPRRARSRARTPPPLARQKRQKRQKRRTRARSGSFPRAPASEAPRHRASVQETLSPPARAQVDDPDVINFLLSTEIIPLCLRIMETGAAP